MSRLTISRPDSYYSGKTYKSLETSFKKLYLDAELSDIRFEFNNSAKIIPAHKNVLAIASPVFKELFYGPKKQTVVKISGIDPDYFEVFLNFFYLEEVALTIGNIDVVTRLTYKYQVYDCCNTCVKFLLSELRQQKDALWMYQLAIDINNDDLKKVCEDFITHASKKLFESVEFQRCEKDMLKRILQMDKLSCSEIDVFRACLTWAESVCKQNNSEDVRQQLGDCFNLIRFGTIDTTEFIVHTMPHKDLFTREEYEDILYKTSMKFNNTPRLNPYLCTTKLPLFSYACRRFDSKIQYDAKPYRIQPTESVWFSMDVPTVVSSIRFAPIYKSTDKYFDNTKTSVDFNVKFIEIISTAFKMGKEEKVVFEGQVTLHSSLNELIFPQKLFIQSDTTYEIRLEMIEYNVYYHDCTWKTQDKCDHFCVTFHQHPRTENRHGLVTELEVDNYYNNNFTYDQFKRSYLR